MRSYASYSYLTFGFLFGYIVGSSSGHPADLASVAPFLAAWALYTLVFLVESWNHRRHLANWQQIRAKGRSHFVLIAYLLLRGSIVVAATVFYFWLVDMIKYPVTLLFILPFLGLVAYGGIHEWSRCDQESKLSTAGTAPN